MQVNIDEVKCMERSGVTVRNYRRRTTVPSGIFDFLRLQDKDQLRWIALNDGTVIVNKIEDDKK